MDSTNVMSAPDPATGSHAFGQCRIIPVVTVDDPDVAVAVARALVAGGLTTIEIALRTARALESIRAVARELPEAVVGAGTVLEPRQMDEAGAAGARFLVSPGATSRLIDAARASRFAWLPGAGTAAEAMRLAEAGFGYQKFFPAEPSGGVAFLKALAPVLATVKFCPTGGIDARRAPAFLELDNVFAVGGSWMVPAAALERRDYVLIQRLSEEAARLATAT